ncbi:MAG: DNA repair protein RecO [Chloroflexi bacterium]|jgi:DNA repair protein RecO (recombination protein O)|nr:DNA repair protein RecO [Chloroflexota bacterium]MBT3668981.1 DNA repair protein RecO [Chloroflexota bacterium]MBT4002829.1 DNA repair protein RecO [Chloroflexota bacterium]MBT4304952.1 DNA repair protein RecO [Chloroflexota bacterium]MBT4533285.1 DNA repair protein RecO [Chloroflexota bacterium]
MSQRDRSFRVEAIVLKHTEFGEADRILSLYTRERGKLRAMVKGARKVRSRKAGHVEPFTLVTLQLAKGRNWYIVTQAEAKNTHQALREDLESIGYAAYIAELLDKFTYDEGHEHNAIYPLLVKTFDRLNRDIDPQITVRYYEIQMLDLLGFRPELQTCVVSDDEIIAQDQFFSVSLGGVVSPEHGKNLPGTTPISVQALKYLRFFQRSRFQDALIANISPEIHRELEVLMQHYVTYQLERGLNSPAFLRRVRHQKENAKNSPD